VTLFDFEFENYSFTGDELKALIYDEIQLYHSEEKREEYEKLKKEFPKGILALKEIGKSKKVMFTILHNSLKNLREKHRVV